MINIVSVTNASGGCLFCRQGMHARNCSTAAHINAVHSVVSLVLAKSADDQKLAHNA
jgi:hypothetical protein